MYIYMAVHRAKSNIHQNPESTGRVRFSINFINTNVLLYCLKYFYIVVNCRWFFRILKLKTLIYIRQTESTCKIRVMVME